MSLIGSFLTGEVLRGDRIANTVYEVSVACLSGGLEGLYISCIHQCYFLLEVQWYHILAHRVVILHFLYYNNVSIITPGKNALLPKNKLHCCRPSFVIQLSILTLHIREPSG